MRTALLGLFLFAPSAFALEPKDMIVVANKNVPESREVADHYLAKRKVPKENLILLDLPKGVVVVADQALGDALGPASVTTRGDDELG